MNEISTPKCEDKRLPAICDVAKKNGELAGDINAGMSSLLDLLTGPNPNGNCDITPPPNCLLDDIVRQGDILSDIHTKLSRALAALNG